MIGPGTGARVLIATKPVDFRKGMDGLAALVAAELGADPFSGVVYVFRAKKADRVKLVWWDGTGLCLMHKKLESGAFRWPGDCRKFRVWAGMRGRKETSHAATQRAYDP